MYRDSKEAELVNEQTWQEMLVKNLQGTTEQRSRKARTAVGKSDPFGPLW